MSRWQRVAGGFGIVLTIAACVFVIFKISEMDAVESKLSGLLSPKLILLCVSYCMLNVVIAAAWAEMVQWLEGGRPSISRRDLVGIYLTSQISKYMPSNTFHWIGRWALLAKRGIPTRVALLSFVFEAVIITAVALLIAAVFRGAVLVDLLFRSNVLVFGAAALLVAMIGGVFFKRYLASKFATLKSEILEFRAPNSLAILAAYTFFYFGCGFILWIILEAYGGAQGGIPVLHAVGIAAFVWVVGFLVPGAGGGIGVREALIILLVSNAVGEEAAVLCAVSYRLVTLGGDVLAALVGMIWWARTQ